MHACMGCSVSVNMQRKKQPLIRDEAHDKKVLVKDCKVQFRRINLVMMTCSAKIITVLKMTVMLSDLVTEKAPWALTSNTEAQILVSVHVYSVHVIKQNVPDRWLDLMLPFSVYREIITFFFLVNYVSVYQKSKDNKQDRTFKQETFLCKAKQENLPHVYNHTNTSHPATPSSLFLCYFCFSPSSWPPYSLFIHIHW